MKERFISIPATGYYKHNGIEAWDIIEVVMTYFGNDITGAEAFYTGNILKYLLRYPYKCLRNEDLDKIITYCVRLKELNPDEYSPGS